MKSGTESICCVVSQLDGLLFRLEPSYRKHRPKDLILHLRHSRSAYEIRSSVDYAIDSLFSYQE